MKANIAPFFLAFALVFCCMLPSFGQTELKILESPIFGNKEIVKVVKQSEEEQKVTLTIYYEGVSRDEAKQVRASILTGGQNPVKDINVITKDLPSGSGNMDITFTFSPSRAYTKPYIQSRNLQILIVKKKEGGNSALDAILGESGSLDDFTAPKYIYLLAKQWRVSPPVDKPDAISSIVIPVKLTPLKSAKTIKP